MKDCNRFNAEKSFQNMSDSESKDGQICSEQMDDEVVRGRSPLEVLSPEVLGLILEFLPAKVLLNLSETSRKIHSECIGNGGIWKSLLKVNLVMDCFLVILASFVEMSENLTVFIFFVVICFYCRVVFFHVSSENDTKILSFYTKLVKNRKN